MGSSKLGLGCWENTGPVVKVSNFFDLPSPKTVKIILYFGKNEYYMSPL